jgi:hypothetical protein
MTVSERHVQKNGCVYLCSKIDLKEKSHETVKNESINFYLALCSPYLALRQPHSPVRVIGRLDLPAKVRNLTLCDKFNMHHIYHVLNLLSLIVKSKRNIRGNMILLVKIVQ